LHSISSTSSRDTNSASTESNFFQQLSFENSEGGGWAYPVSSALKIRSTIEGGENSHLRIIFGWDSSVDGSLYYLKYK
jgi:hypothetical protein